MRNKILLIEDDEVLAHTLQDFLEDNALQVWHTPSGEDGLRLYHAEKPDLILLDVILPQKSGFEVIAEIRDKDIHIPIIMMTGTEFDEKSQIRGFQHHATNYIKKPVIPQVLLTQIKSTLVLSEQLMTYKFGETSLYLDTQHVQINGDSFNIREKESQLLHLLLQRKGQVVDRPFILKQVWGDDHPNKNNLLDGAMSRIRGIIKKSPNIEIKTVYGEGYRLVVETKKS